MRPPADAPRPAEPADPAVLGALLARHGWRRRGGTTGRYGRWTPPPPNGTGGPSLLVPEDPALPDTADLLAEARTALERSTDPTARHILLALTTPGDEIRCVRRTPAPDADWTAQDRLRAGVRALLTAGALAARATAGHHGARHRRTAEAALGGLLLGPGGSARELTVLAPLGPGATYGRPAVAVLLTALYAARDATDYQRATGRTDAFTAAVRAGVCRELTEALVGLVAGAEGIRVHLAWAPAAGPPPGHAAHPEPVEFSPGDLPALRAASARYLCDEPAVPVRLTGTVAHLWRESPGGGGSVRLRVLAGADVGEVRAELGETDYRAAGHAHLAGRPVRLDGRLESGGGFRRLADAGGVLPLPVDDAERERLLKALHTDPDGFGDRDGDGV
ncbi:hypothetical protein [Streptomyces mobaraensis]|uniref:Uncharacterized protein n=1 Tax=Streptomyces mobaraensis TaxID=35621 RepID=A0A5N5VXW4_STRMB|nr:hypothetical protein [Streptomyces mobaraensis]KAB7833637.1 hypothetical protein FRZ00_33190 [Streptomyces mobaraensis]